jgi:hypothetical protein
MHRHRLFVVLVVILAGVSLIPFIGMASERFGWQRFAGLYEPDPNLVINYRTGRPGSYFTVTGSNFPPNVVAIVTINGHTLGELSTDGAGEFAFLLRTIEDTDPGAYFARAMVNPSAGVSFRLDPDEPLRLQEGTGTVFDVPDGIAFTRFVYLPIILRGSAG